MAKLQLLPQNQIESNYASISYNCLSIAGYDKAFKLQNNCTPYPCVLTLYLKLDGKVGLLSITSPTLRLSVNDSGILDLCCYQF